MSEIDEKLEKINKIVGPDALFSTQEELEELTKKNKATIDSIKSSLEDIATLNNKSIIKYIELGKILLNAKQNLGIRFSAIITDEIITTKQVQRYLKLIITLDSEEKYTKSMKAKKEDIDLLIADDRITSLTEDKIKNMLKPSMNKLIRMKALSDENFQKVLNGDDTELNKHLDELKKKEKELSDKKKYDEKPENMDKDTFDKLLDMGVYEITRKYQESLDREAELQKENQKLKEERIKLDIESSTAMSMLNKIATGGLYQPSKQKEVETA